MSGGPAAPAPSAGACRSANSSDVVDGRRSIPAAASRSRASDHAPRTRRRLSGSWRRRRVRRQAAYASANITAANTATAAATAITTTVTTRARVPVDFVGELGGGARGWPRLVVGVDAAVVGVVV